MTAVTSISNEAARAALNAITALLNVGGPGYIQIRSGTQPANVDVAATGSLLGTLPLSATAFGAATAQTGYAQSSANPITDETSVDAAGTATWFRAFNGAGTAVIDGNVGLLADARAMTLSNTALAVNDNIEIDPWHLILSET